MSDILKCPFCGGILEQSSIYNINSYACTDLACKGYFMTATKDMWQELIRTRKVLDKGMEHITGLNNMIESWLNLIDDDLDQETKLHILKSAISAYVENKGGENG